MHIPYKFNKIFRFLSKQTTIQMYIYMKSGLLYFFDSLNTCFRISPMFEEVQKCDNIVYNP
jgi:hypothetical protein